MKPNPVPLSHHRWAVALDLLPWRRWMPLVAVAVGGSLFYGASLGLLLTEWDVAAAAWWLALSAGLAWCVLIPVLCRLGRLRWAPCIDACLRTMAHGEVVLTLGALLNLLLWWRGATVPAVAINVLIVGISNGVMARALVSRLGTKGMAPRQVWLAWMLALNGSGAVFFLILYQWFLRA